MKETEAPVFIPVLSRTTSDDLTMKMKMVDHRCVKQDGPPDMINEFSEDPDTEVDGVIDSVVWDEMELGRYENPKY